MAHCNHTVGGGFQVARKVGDGCFETNVAKFYVMLVAASMSCVCTQVCGAGLLEKNFERGLIVLGGGSLECSSGVRFLVVFVYCGVWLPALGFYRDAYILRNLKTDV
ncbi:hypothetical protein BDZ94DRAFT_1265671 [Collybia nuda]|uniref:Uncharacterized protein n=1 Tax=Collybia nuda TaxID=64659 RepID=A0A9P5Y1G8_9AGAR|nr:hypothetical protein BDZ94DRAFT_1265671 [Collybia nuda]